MTIYQLHEYSGEWEDYRDRIIGSYLRKERAEEEKSHEIYQQNAEAFYMCFLSDKKQSGKQQETRNL